jgi:HSP20 family molecular chaperone IbpA
MFKRTIPLPWDLDYESAAATYNNGVLNVSIPKTQVEKQKFKKISVNTDKN